MGTRQVVTIAGAAILGLTLVSSGVQAQDLYAGIRARVPDLALMTMLFGPLDDGASCAADMLLRRVAIGDQRLQTIPIPGRELDPHFLAHTSRFASNPPVGNPSFRTDH